MGGAILVPFALVWLGLALLDRCRTRRETERAYDRLVRHNITAALRETRGGVREARPVGWL